MPPRRGGLDARTPEAPGLTSWQLCAHRATQSASDACPPPSLGTVTLGQSPAKQDSQNTWAWAPITDLLRQFNYFVWGISSKCTFFTLVGIGLRGGGWYLIVIHNFGVVYPTCIRRKRMNTNNTIWTKYIGMIDFSVLFLTRESFPRSWHKKLVITVCWEGWAQETL